MSRVTVPILVYTNPYSLEKRKYGEVSGSGHAAYKSSIRIRIFPESNFFCGTEYPIPGHVIETRRVKTCKRPYFSRSWSAVDERTCARVSLALLSPYIP